MNPADCRNRLIELLETQNSRIDRANDYLDSIKQAIMENQLDNLQQTLNSPDLAISDIEQLEQQRYQLLSSFGFDGDGDGFTKCMVWCDDEKGQVDTLYQQLIQSLLKLQHAIQINSLLITKGRDRVRRSLGILTGLGAGGSCKTYSSNGKTNDPSGRRDIAIA